MITSRRSLILGSLSLLAAPVIVKATSLMGLRGYNMDPKVLAFHDPIYGEWVISAIPGCGDFSLAAQLSPYDLVRLSQTISFPTHFGTERDASKVAPLSVHIKALETIKSHRELAKTYRELATVL